MGLPPPASSAVVLHVLKLGSGSEVGWVRPFLREAFTVPRVEAEREQGVWGGRRRGASAWGRVWVKALEAEPLEAAALSYILPCTVSPVCWLSLIPSDAWSQVCCGDLGKHLEQLHKEVSRGERGLPPLPGLWCQGGSQQ